MEKHTTNHLLMIRPYRFIYNAQTAVNNAFQVESDDQELVQKEAIAEFDQFVAKLRQAGVDVTVVQDTIEPHTPDSIFPNNWVSFHANGSAILYPMYALNRRLERKPSVMEKVQEKFAISQWKDYADYEDVDVFLEGTGSMVLDREKKIAYACLSPRTNKVLFEKWCLENDYLPISFLATDINGQDIYHTNVIMAVADKYVVICLDTIKDPEERKLVEKTIASSGKEIIQISFDQMNRFAGNMLQVEDKKGNPLLVMSQQAWESLNDQQKSKLKSYNEVLYSNLKTIESNGGGSARCMMAEIHVPLKTQAE